MKKTSIRDMYRIAMTSYAISLICVLACGNL